MTRPGEARYTERTPRVAAARRLTRRAGRTGAGLFLAEGTQAVREALRGGGTVVFSTDSVDPYNGKCVRASAGSLFHLPVVRDADPEQAVDALRAAGLRVLAAAGDGEADLDDLADGGALAAPTAWLFGNEA